jgi:hypothetical protein
MVIIEIGGVPYQLVNTDGVPELRLYNDTGSGYTGLKSPTLDDETIKIFTMPADFAESGLSGHLVVDEDGNITVLSPGTFLADLPALATLTDVINRINTIQTQLINKFILQPQIVINTPQPVIGYGTVADNQAITPEPATAYAAVAGPTVT